MLEKTIAPALSIESSLHVVLFGDLKIIPWPAVPTRTLPPETFIFGGVGGATGGACMIANENPPAEGPCAAFPKSLKTVRKPVALFTVQIAKSKFEPLHPEIYTVPS